MSRSLGELLGRMVYDSADSYAALLSDALARLAESSTSSSAFVNRFKVQRALTIHGVLIDAYAAIGGVAHSLVHLRLTDSQRLFWKDELRNLLVLFSDSGALQLGALVYQADDALICELGPSGHTLLIAVHQDGTTVSFRRESEDFESYVSRNWDRFPLLQEFMEMVVEYPRLGRSEWNNHRNLNPNPRVSLATSTSVAASAAVPNNPISTHRTAAFAS